MIQVVYLNFYVYNVLSKWSRDWFDFINEHNVLRLRYFLPHSDDLNNAFDTTQIRVVLSVVLLMLSFLPKNI